MVLSGFALLLASACGGGDSGSPVAPPPPPPSPEALTALTLNPATASLTVGTTTTLVPAPTTGGSAVSVSYTYTSDTPAVAAVNASGVVTAVSAGSATITVAATGSGSGFTSSTRQATAVITVTTPPSALTGLTVTPDSVLLLTGARATIVAEASTAGAGVSIVYAYATSASGVATVTDVGVITAVSPGSAIVTVTANGSGTGYAANARQAQVSVIVTTPPPALTALSVSPDSVALRPGDSAAIIPSATTAGGQVSVQYAFTSSATTVAPVSSSGVITAVTPGTAVITVAATGSGVGVRTVERQATVTVTVAVPPLPVWRRVAGHPGEGWAARWGNWTVAAGRLWVVENEDLSTAAPRIHWSENGDTWQTLDARTVGLPAWQIGSDYYGSNNTLVTGTDDEVVIATTLLSPGNVSSPDRTQPWVIRGTPGNWRVQGPSNSPGLNPLQIPMQGGFRFAASGMIGAAASWNDRVVLLGRGMWWVPGGTTDQSFLSLTSGASGDWQLFGKRDHPWGASSFQWMTGAAGTPWGFFAVGHVAFKTEVWHSADGYAWNVITDPVRSLGGSRERSAEVWSGAMMYGARGLVMARVRDVPSAQIVAWSTRDGQNWEESVVADQAYGDVQGFATGTHYVVTVPQSTSSLDRLLRHVWVSRDALQWVRIPEGPHFTKIIGWGDRLWGFRSGQVWELDVSSVGRD